VWRPGAEELQLYILTASNMEVQNFSVLALDLKRLIMYMTERIQHPRPPVPSLRITGVPLGIFKLVNRFSSFRIIYYLIKRERSQVVFEMKQTN